MAWDNSYGGGRQKRRSAAPKRKKSGAREGLDKNDRHYVSGWRKGKNCGFVSAIFSEDRKFPKSGEAERGSLAGHKWVRYRGQLQFKDQGNSQWVTGIWWPSLGKLKIPKLGWVLSTKAANGGFFGSSRKPKSNNSY